MLSACTVVEIGPSLCDYRYTEIKCRNLPTAAVLRTIECPSLVSRRLPPVLRELPKGPDGIRMGQCNFAPVFQQYRCRCVEHRV